LDAEGHKIPLTAYGWGHCVRKPAQNALVNSDNYALLGLMAWLARQGRHNPETGAVIGGYTLRRRNLTADPITQTQIEFDAMDGYLHYYPDLTTPGDCQIS
jgi:hypothetical protein